MYEFDKQLFVYYAFVQGSFPTNVSQIPNLVELIFFGVREIVNICANKSVTYLICCELMKEVIVTIMSDIRFMLKSLIFDSVFRVGISLH